MVKKYQIFVSSTYNDLIEERSAAIHVIINQRQIPAGMEFFGAVGEKQWDYIKKEIDSSDYYLLIVGGRYGSVNEQGIGYTEEEFDYACSRGIRVLAFLVKDVNTLPVGKCESTKKGREQLARFRNKVEKNAGLVAYWSDIYDLQLQMGNSLSNVLREYPAQSGWIRIDKETDKADSFNPKADIAYDSGQEDKWILFPELKSTVLPNSQVNYDVTDPSKAVVICGSSYVQLQTRDGRIEPYMVDTCLEFIGLTQARNTCLKEDEMFCLRSLWFNSVSSEVTVYLDYLYEYGNTPEYSVQRVKNMFRDGEVLGDGILYETMVRCMPVSMDSEHFYENNKEFYKSQDLSSYLSFSWGDGKFSFMDGTKRMVGGNIKVNNNYQQPLTFTINGEFESAGENDRILGTKVLEPVQAEDEMGNRIFTLEGHEAKTLSLLFKSTAGEGYKSEKPFRLYLSVKDDSPDYQ